MLPEFIPAIARSKLTSVHGTPWIRTCSWHASSLRPIMQRFGLKQVAHTALCMEPSELLGYTGTTDSREPVVTPVGASCEHRCVTTGSREPVVAPESGSCDHRLARAGAPKLVFSLERGHDCVTTGSREPVVTPVTTGSRELVVT